MTRPRTTPPVPAAPATEAAALFATVRDTLRANGVMRYGSFERRNTYAALSALDALVSLVAATEQQRDEAVSGWDRACAELLDTHNRAEAAEQQRDEARVWDCPFCRFEMEDGRDELESHLQFCSGMSHWRAEAAERRAAETEAALDVNTPCCKGSCHPLNWCDQCSAIVRARAALSAGGPERTTT